MVGETDTRADNGGTHTVHVDVDADEPLSTHVVEAVASAAGVNSTAAGFDLYDAVDGDALDTLHQHAQRTDTEWELAFDAAGREVVVSSDGTVTVR